jgi:hypothetical protein
MTPTLWCALLVVVATFAWLAGFELCWRWYVVPALRAELERPNEPWPIVQHEPPSGRVETTADLATFDYRMRVVGAQRVVLHYNAQPEARN